MPIKVTQLPAELAAQLGVSAELAQSIACAVGALCSQGPAAVDAVVNCPDARLGELIKTGVVMMTECARSESAAPSIDERAPPPENIGHTAIGDALDALNRELSERRLSRDIYDTRVVRTSFGGVIATVVKVGGREP